MLLPLALALAAAMSASGTAPPPDAAPPATAGPAPLPPDEQFATARDRAARMTVATSIDGKGPYRFAIDTAAERSVVSDRLADALALPAGAPMRMQAVTGPDIVSSVHVARLGLGRGERRNLHLPVVAERALGAAGLLGLDALAGKRVVLDFRAGHMSIGSSVPVRFAEPADPDVIVVTARSRFGQLILTDVALGGHKVYAIIDTGAQNTLGNAAFAALLARQRKQPLVTRPATLVGVTGRTTPVAVTSVHRITIAGLEVRDMPVAIADVRTFALFKVDKTPAILLGMDVLQAFDRVAIDFGRREIRFRVAIGRAGSAAQLASATSREGVSSCGSSCASPPAG